MPQTSTFLIGSYRNGTWACACDRPPAWYAVNKEGPTKGQRFLRCKPTGTQSQCNFFLWEIHEASARKQVISRQSSLQTTPTRSPNSSRALPTPPPSSDARRSGRLTSPRASSSPTTSRQILNRTSTPSQSRHRNRWEDEDDEDDDDQDDEDEDEDEEEDIYGYYSDDEGVLIERITNCLLSDGVNFGVRTGHRMDSIIREEFAAYRAKLDERDETIAKLTRRLERVMARADR